MNRAWAIIRPMSFRAAHTKRFTLTVCMVMWLYIQLVEGFFWLADTLYFQMDVPIKMVVDPILLVLTVDQLRMTRLRQ
ncbi:hypothetical protein BV898_14912 [Hypsibius exemplaris]|uniref:Uncharacterized protein n=1 Tax=Hypsibius exemplaris TaxID=2072580 RepID=A0A9X6ND15_HYPEX|nr:hypothetical protein BV898_14912 [Hypsibius exemplaris]